jgi:hypothetical protein
MAIAGMAWFTTRGMFPDARDIRQLNGMFLYTYNRMRFLNRIDYTLTFW